MGSVDESLREIAAEFVALVSKDYGLVLDWSIGSLEDLDAVCLALLADGPLLDERLDLWSNLVGAYTGEALIRAYDGEWIAMDELQGHCAVRLPRGTAFPFDTAHRVLTGEAFKSLVSMARAYPAIVELQTPTSLVADVPTQDPFRRALALLARLARRSPS